MRPHVALLTALLAPAVASAQQLASTRSARDDMPAPGVATATTARAVRAVEPPVLDGKGDDAVWRTAQVIDQFLEYDPNEGAVPRFKTELRIAYDEKNLYVLARMYDPAPDSIVSLLSRRDVRTNSEWLKLVIDSYHDRRTGYEFIVNPAGVKRDFYVYNDQNEDPSWDGVWDVATRIDSLGWVAEFRIPFSQLRFPKQDEHTFGLMAVRDVARTGQRISWPLYHRNVQGYVSQAGEIRGIDGIATPRRLEVSPYVVTQSANKPQGAGFAQAQSVTGGADLKYGLGPNLTLDATINPDFGQVEADPAVLNLSAFETFFDERRPFFLEGAGTFDFRVNCGDIDTGCTGLFYSRRIGRSPQLGWLYGDENSPTATTILGAAKVTGRTSNGLSLGLLGAATQREQGVGGLTVEPRTSYVVARALQDFHRGRTSVGAMLTAVDRDLDSASAPYLRRGAYAGGVDVRHRFFADNYEVAAMASGSMLRGTPDALALTQADGVHAYQRPDDRVAYDPTRTSLGGDAERISVSKFGGGITRFQTVYQRYSPGYEINDLGFLSRADEQMFRNWFAFIFNKPRLFYRYFQLNLNSFNTWTAAGLPTNFGLNTNWHTQLNNFWWAHYGINFNNFLGDTYNDRAARGGPAIRRSTDINMWSGLQLDTRKPLVPAVWSGMNTSDGGRSWGWYTNPTLDLRAASRFSASVGVSLSRSHNQSQWRANFGDVGSDTTHYTFATLDQTTVSMTSRLNFTASPTLSLQFYAQPFVSTGTYSDWRELADPRAKEYAARYRPFTSQGDPGGFDFKQFRSNTVLRWEYRPGSTLFLVWQQGRQLFDPTASDFSLHRDYGNLFDLHPSNTLLVKASYWLSM